VPILNNKQIPDWAARVLAFFVHKGLLFTNLELPGAGGKLPIKDVLRTADKYEPRVLQVFPAAYIHFPRTFIGQKDLPPQLQEVIVAIKRGQKTGRDYRGIPYKEMLLWAELRLNDRRTKPLREIRRNKTLRIRPDVFKKLAQLSVKTGKPETVLFEELILQA